MATYTPNYGLHQWEPEDDFLRTDFNIDFEKIDDALDSLQQLTGQKSKILTGIYQGDDTAERFINLDLTPKAVMLETLHGMRTNLQQGDAYGGILLPDAATPGGAIVEGGFQVRDNSHANTNTAVYTYLYIAFA